MRVLWAGTFDPGFSRNLKLARLMAVSKIPYLVVREDVWAPDRVGLAMRPGVRVALAALVKYPLLLLRLLASPRPDLYLVSYPGWFDVPIVRLVATLKRRPLVFDPFVSLYDTMISDRQLHTSRSSIARLARAADRWSFRMADVLIADTAPQLDLYEELAKGSKAKGVVIPVGADDGVFVPRADLEIVPTSILFYGSFVPLQGVPTIVEAAALLESDGVRVVIIGDGQDRPAVEAAIKRTGATVEMIGPMPLDELPLHVGRAEICLGIFGMSDKAGRVVPHKLYECVAMGRPVITRDGPGIRSLFDEGEVVMVPPADPRALADAVRDLIADPTRRERIAAAGQAAYSQRFNERALAELLVAAFESAVD